jgi:hypothetical protein
MFERQGRCTCTPMTDIGVMVQDPHCALHGTPRFTFSVSESKPEPSVPLSAIRALVEEMREEIKRVYAITGRCEVPALLVSMWLDQLAALCPAPPTVK